MYLSKLGMIDTTTAMSSLKTHFNYENIIFDKNIIEQIY